MFTIAGIGFATPVLLLGLLALPLLWMLLRAVPPAPIKRLFPGVVLLLGLDDKDNQSDKTPWWLLVLRSLAIAGLILGFSGPVLSPEGTETSGAPVLVLMDGGWADATDWSARLERLDAMVRDAAGQGRPLAIARLSDLPPGDLEFLSADVWISRLVGLEPDPWEPDEQTSLEWVATLEGDFDTVWFADGLAHENRERMLGKLESHGKVQVFESTKPVIGLRPPYVEAGSLVLEVVRSATGPSPTGSISVLGFDPGGLERVLEQVPYTFEPGQSMAAASVGIQPEIRNRITRFVVDGYATAATVVLSDDALKRRQVAILGGPSDQEGLQLLSPTHFLEQALIPNADLIKGTIADVILASPDVMVLADVANLAATEAQDIEAWVREGGLLLRFSGPKLAASDISRGVENALMPVRLRAGGRTVGGTMSWGEPKKLQAFQQGSPFFGLNIPDDVEVTAQVIAEPDPNLSSRVIAALSDGTPLVTRKDLGAGQVVLFHVTANAEWSSLPLSGLFVEMLDRLAVSGRSGRPGSRELNGTIWTPDQVLDGFGALHSVDDKAGVGGENIASGKTGPQMLPGLYKSNAQTLALNVIQADRELKPALWPPGTDIGSFATVSPTNLMAVFLAASLMLLAVDLFAALWLAGRLHGAISGTSVALLPLCLIIPYEAKAQDDLAFSATGQVVLAHVTTGNPEVDRVAEAGLRGLSDVLFRRTSVEPSNPIAVNIELDELAFFPFIYWPMTTDQPQPSAAAIARLNRYIQTGGMILFDTMDADIAGYGMSSPNGRKLQQIAGSMEIPPLEPLPDDHVLTRTFYLLDQYPGRYTGRNIWVEASAVDAELAEGMPFRNLNDNVTPVVIGGNDWASAWAVDEVGNWMFPVGRGSTGERQREIAYRFGVNLIMYVLTGNYKSDQVHVPALLDRLGQ